MKNLLFLFGCLFLITSLEAQFMQGQRMIDGQLTFNNQHIEANSVVPMSNSANLNAAFSLSHFASQSTINGFGLSYGYADIPSNYIINSLGAFYNYTKLETLAKHFYLSLGGTTAINYSETKYPEPSFTYTIKQTSITPSISFDLGLLYQINNRFLATANLVNLANLSYSFTSTIKNQNGNSTPYTTKSNSIYLHSGLNGFNLNSISIGFRYLLKK